MKTVKLEPSEDLGQMMVPVAIDLSFVTSVKLEDMPILEQVLAKTTEDVLKRFQKDGFKVFVRAGVVRPMTQEELLSILPRKVHMAHEDGWLCDTAHVALKNVTDNRDDVTCKLCLKKLPP
jgi:hypothetical protein